MFFWGFFYVYLDFFSYFSASSGRWAFEEEKIHVPQKEILLNISVLCNMDAKQRLTLLPASTEDSGQSAFSMAVSRALFVFV